MQSVLILSVCALTAGVSPPNSWPLDGLDTTNNFRNLLLHGNRPVRQGGPYPQTPVGYTTNNANGFGSLPYGRINGVNPQQNQLPNLPINNIQWLPILPPNNAYPFLSPPVKNQNDPDFQRALNNFINIQSNNLDGVPKTYGQKLAQPGLIQAVGRTVDKKPPRSNPTYINSVPPQNQVQYITYTTPQSVPQLNNQNGNNNQKQPLQAAAFNMKQAHPQVNTQNTIPPFIELDFNPKNPFNPSQDNKLAKQNPFARGTNGQTNGFGTVQPVINFGINFNTPYPQNHPPVAPNINKFSPVAQIQLPISNKNPDRISSTPPSVILDFSPNNPFNKNYRDDITHEPVHEPPNHFFDTEETPRVERLEHEKAPVSYHENPPDVPTRPIYPGEGKWAKFGVKHRPHISPHKFTSTLEESTHIPDGYDTFLDGQKLFDFQNNQFGQKLTEFPQRHQLGTALPNSPPSPYYEQRQPQGREEEQEDKGEDEFVPSRLYAQVRQTEEEKHLPPAADENGRLKELLKDSITHTIYSEEGYEDSAYDHAGHEKKAEKAEGFEKDKKEVVDNKAKTEKLQKPQPVITSYGDDKKLKKEEFEALKEEALEFDDEEDDDEDSETEATEYDKSIISKVKPPKKVYSAKTKDASKYKVKVDDIVEGRGSSPISTIVKGDGNTEIEISSEVKVIVQPNNVTKAHKYVKIYPKFRKITKNEDDLRNDTTGTEIAEIPFTTISPSIEEIFTVEIPATTQATTAIPRIKTPQSPHKRRKRDTDAFPEIEIDTDFIDKINHTLPDPPDKEALMRAKFPYYLDFKKMGIDESSALRYSEDLTKAPAKTNDKFAFYNQADRKKECSEVEPIVDPVPERIKNADKNPEAEETTDVAEIADSPRLGQLGDKIDCFKAKYFGENPFDNPLFEEKSVGRVEPIFAEIDRIVKKPPVKRETSPDNSNDKNTKRDLRNKRDPTELKDETADGEKSEEWEAHMGTYPDYDDNKEEKEIIKSDKPTKEIDNNFITENSINPKDDAETVDVTNIHTIKESQSEVNTLATPTLITTPKYTIDLKPKHIYDQIELLDYLPVDDDSATTDKSPAEKPKDVPNKEGNLNKSKSRKEKQYTLHKIKENNVDKITTDKLKDTKQRSSDKEKIFEKYSLFDEDEKKTEEPKTIDNTNIDDTDDSENLEKLSEKGTETTLTYSPRGSKAKADIARKVNKIKKKIKSKLDGAPSKAKAKGVYEKRRGRGRVFKTIETTTEVDGATEKNEALPEAEPLKRHRRLRKRSRFPFIFDINPYIPKIPVAKPPFVDIILTPRPSYLREVDIPDIPDASVFEIFDINKYLPTTETIGSETNVLPKYKVMSEVFYKDEIKPDEQLNVFTDVFNNIKNSPYQQDMYNAASEQFSVKVKPDDSLIRNSEITEDWKSTTIVPGTRLNKYKNQQLLDLENSYQNKVADNIRNHEIASSKTKLKHRSTTTEPDALYRIHKNHKMHNDAIPLQEDSENLYEANHKIKRKEKISTTTINPSESVIEDEDKDDSTDVMGLVPPEPHGYRTIYKPKRDNSQDIANEGTVEQNIINKYIVPGMKPPPKRRVYNYSDYLTANHIRQKMSNRKRVKRSAARPAYAEVTRNRGVQEIEVKNDTTTDDVDDYIPHRPKNYRYDEKTGRIVYDKKPETQEESEEVEYIEVVEETPTTTTSKPKQNPIFATATPPPEGQSYVDFVKLLKSSSNYHEIPDPTTTEKGQEPSTTEATSSTTEKPVSTTPPEFLSILAKVRNDSNYKVIEDKKKSRSTTTKSPEEEHVADAEDVESQVQPVKNSPGSMGIVHGQMLNLFDITDFLPKVKNYMPKTIIDTSRYKTIQRPTSRHSLSSRYNSEEEKDLQNINTSKKPLLNSDEKTGETKETSIEKVVSPTIASIVKNVRRGTPFTTTTTTVRPAQASVTPKVNRGRGRRVTTSKSIVTTQGDATSPELTRNRRTYRRRNLRLTPTTTAATNTTGKPVVRTADTPKIIHRRSQRDSTTLSSENKELILPENRANVKQIRSQGEAPTKLSDETATDTDTAQVAQKVVNIFKNYDRIRRRGGNNKEVNEVIASENRLGQSQQNRIVPQNADVDVFKNYDKTKKHGGNYRAENENNAQLKENQSAEDSDVFKDFDKTKKNGGNYRKETESEESKQAIVDESENQKANDVETFKDYDKAKKHGGNYRSEDEAQQLNEPQLEESRVLTPKGNQIDANTGKVKDVEAFKDYDKNRKHGGNYISEEEAKRLASSQAKAKDIEIFNNYDKTKKHGGNYRGERDDVIDPEIEESGYDNLDSEQKLQSKRNNDKDPTLIDVVFRPETFYTDPKLPTVINGLKIIDDLPNDELEKIVSDHESSSEELGESSEYERKDSQNVIGRDVRTIDPERTTKKPLFIKDPSQRLYFYAPLR